jgi:hypothetical protein
MKSSIALRKNTIKPCVAGLIRKPISEIEVRNKPHFKDVGLWKGAKNDTRQA